MTCVDLLVTHPMTGHSTALARTVRRALKALAKPGIAHCVIGATALAVRGFPRMTRDLDLTVRAEDTEAALSALRSTGLQPQTPTESDQEFEPMILLRDPVTDVEVDLLAASGDPERTVIHEATRTLVFGVRAPVATLEHLLILYLYSNQPRHLGDFATIVQSGQADLARAERGLRQMHREMLPEWKRRVGLALSPLPRFPRPGKNRGPA
jgi:hypothetical protein